MFFLRRYLCCIFFLCPLSSTQANPLSKETQAYSSQRKCYYLFKNRQVKTFVQPIGSLKLSPQTENILKNANILFRIDLVTKTRKDLLSIPQIGGDRLAEIEKALFEDKQQLDMKINVDAEKLSALLRKLTPKVDIALLLQPIELLEFSTDTWFAIKTEKINYFGELLMRSKEELSVRGDNLVELEKFLSENGFYLGMDTGVSYEQLKELIVILTGKIHLDFPFLVQTIAQSEFSPKIKEPAERAGILYVGELVTKNREILLGAYGFRIDMLYEIEREFVKRGMYLGTDVGMSSEQFKRLLRERKSQVSFLFIKQTIDRLNLSLELQETVKKSGMFFIEDLLAKTEEELLMSGFTKDQVNEIKKALSVHKLQLGMKREWMLDFDTFRFFQMFHWW